MPQSGIRYAPLFESIMAARWRGYKDEEFEQLPVVAQARIIAAYRLYGQIEGVIAQEQIRKMREEGNRG